LRKARLIVLSLSVLIHGLVSAGFDVQSVLEKADVAGGLMVVVGLEAEGVGEQEVA